MADNAAKALKMARLLALAHIIVGVLLFIFGIVDRVHGTDTSGAEKAATSSPGSSRFSIWRRLGRRLWHTAESRDQNFQRGWKCI